MSTEAGRGESLLVRDEIADDVPAVRELNRRAFGQDGEAALVDALRENCPDLLSLVALQDERLVGHLLLSPARIEGPHGCAEGMALGPMAVLPERQRRGIGSRLVNEGVERLRQRSCPFVIVLGHAAYYPRFGFVPAARHGVLCPWEVPEEVFMILPLRPAALKGVTGLARYRPEFAEEL